MSIAVPDFGTPAVGSNGTVSGSPMVELTIDGQAVSVPAGTSIMRAARENALDIPKLCATDNLNAFGSCRVCLVEIEGRRGLAASCTEPVQDGMVVRTQTDQVARVRKGVLELYISDHPLDCLTCPANGDCELETVAGAVGSETCVTRTAPTISAQRSTPRTRTSSSTPRSASSARAACGPATRCRGRWLSPSTDAASPPRWRPTARASSTRSASRAAPACRPAPPRRSSRNRWSSTASPIAASTPPAPTAASAARSAPRSRATPLYAWSRTRTARRTTAIPASRDASPGATPITPTASRRRWCASPPATPGAKWNGRRPSTTPPAA